MRTSTTGTLVIEGLQGINVRVSKDVNWLDSASSKYAHYPYVLGSGSGADLPLVDVSSCAVLFIEGNHSFNLTLNGSIGPFPVKHFLCYGATITSIHVDDIAGGTTIEVILSGNS